MPANTPDELIATAKRILKWRKHPAQTMAKQVALDYLRLRIKLGRVEALVYPNPFHDDIPIMMHTLRRALDG